ncbi:hypothetical protein [Streptomyces sp. NPDC094468]|uniref:hypothetical protein n=1 Tax=Streptomyces sp. NPDC094468 TaxID=3366066 RepID=UPI0038119385
MTRRRHTADTITDPILDALYANATRGWRRGDRWKRRAVAAEAAIARLTAWCDELDANMQAIAHTPDLQHPVAANIRAKLTAPEENNAP